jgi:hypothetical protein
VATQFFALPKSAARAAPPAKEQADAADPAGDLARSQSADGSFGGDVARTAAALLALVRLGHTRRAGLRRRTVLKAATWLAAHAAQDARAVLALGALDRAERGEPTAQTAAWAQLASAGAEGRILADLLR